MEYRVERFDLLRGPIDGSCAANRERGVSNRFVGMSSVHWPPACCSESTVCARLGAGQLKIEQARTRSYDQNLTLSAQLVGLGRSITTPGTSLIANEGRAFYPKPVAIGASRRDKVLGGDFAALWSAYLDESMVERRVTAVAGFGESGECLRESGWIARANSAVDLAQRRAHERWHRLAQRLGKSWN
jgi:hypothetical protein